MPTAKPDIEATPQLLCVPMRLDPALRVEAASRACEVNPLNAPNLDHVGELVRGAPRQLDRPEMLALLTAKYWGQGGVRLTVGFLEDTLPELRSRIVSHMNSWSQYGNVHFVQVPDGNTAQVRITLAGSGYWSYLGTDILSIPQGQPTMCLQGFSMSTPESEYHRVVRHETGHTLGFPHEHLRPEVVARLDPRKTVAWGQRVLGWDARTVQEQILTPLDPSKIKATDKPDEASIMAYQLPGECTKDGHPIAGGVDIDSIDQRFVGQIYPLTTSPPPPPGGELLATFDGDLSRGQYTLTRVADHVPETNHQDPQAALVGEPPHGMTREQWIALILSVIEALRKGFPAPPAAREEVKKGK